MIYGFSHAALYTSSLEQTAQFYMDAFGAENLGSFTAAARGCWLKLGGDILEIFEGPDLGDGCFKHIALDCDCVDTAYARALQYGAEAYVEPKDITLTLHTPIRARIAFVRGINGEQIELFCQQKEGPYGRI